MPDPADSLDGGPGEVDDPSGDEGAGRRARARLDRIGASVLRRLNLAGLLLLATGLCVADFLAVGNVFATGLLTGLQVLLAIPWAWTVVRMDQVEARVLDSKRLGRFRRVAGHAVNFTLLATVLGVKAVVVHTAGRETFERVDEAYRTYVVFVLVLFAVGLVGRGSRLARFLGSLADHPARLMAISFAVVALFGGFLLTLPVSVQDWQAANFVDGLFTATSAVCVTGLTVNDVGATYTRFGQAVIFLLIQAGGLGIMVLTASVAILAGRRLKTRSTATLTEMIDAESFAALRRTIRHIFVFTLVLETLGFLALLAAFQTHPEVALGPEADHPAAGAGSVVWSAAFHSVSAFCNAGFSLCHGNLVAFGGSWGVSFAIAALILLGGIGFPVMEELWTRWKRRRRGPVARLSLHARVVLATSGALVALGTVLYIALEGAGEAFDHLSVPERLLAALFQSVTTRTAGFNTVDFGKMGPAALLATCFLMYVGGSPGSCAGGVKTTSVAVLLAAFRAEIRGASLPRLFDRAVPEGVVRKAASVALGATAVVGVSWLVLLMTESEFLEREPRASLRLLFEVVSAFATCGLSTGITPSLTDPGKLVLTLLMFVGRIGPVTLALAAVAKPRIEHYQVPQEKVLIG